MAESLAKLMSCVAYARRSCYKAGFGRIASKLTPVLLELKAEMDLLSAEPAQRMEVGSQTDPCVNPAAKSVNEGECQGGTGIACQTDGEVISRRQCEAIVQTLETKFSTAMEQTTRQLEEQVDIIQNLREQLQRQAQGSVAMATCSATDTGTDRQDTTMRHGDELSKPSSDGSFDLQALKDDHRARRLALKQQRREDRQQRLQESKASRAFEDADTW